MDAPSQTDPVERRTVEILRAERKRQGLSATELAKKVGINPSTLTHLERDIARPTLWVLLAVAAGLGVSLAHALHRAIDETKR